MARPKPNGSPKDANTATIAFEATAQRASAIPPRKAILRSLRAAKDSLWLTADNLRNNMDAADWSGATKTAAGSPQGERGGANQYKHVVLGLIFLKYISDTAGKCRMSNAEVRTRNARPIRHSKFVLRHLPPPADARWSHLQASAKQPTIGKTVDDAMVAIERDWQMSNAEVRMWN